MAEHPAHPEHETEYEIDDEPQETTEHVLTARQILENAGIDPSNHYLVEVQGDHQVSYKDNPETQIHIHEHQKFYSNKTGPTPVS